MQSHNCKICSHKNGQMKEKTFESKNKLTTSNLKLLLNLSFDIKLFYQVCLIYLIILIKLLSN